MSSCNDCKNFETKGVTFENFRKEHREFWVVMWSRGGLLEGSRWVLDEREAKDIASRKANELKDFWVYIIDAKTSWELRPGQGR